MTVEEMDAEHSDDAFGLLRALGRRIIRGLVYMSALALVVVIVCGAWVW